MHGRVHFASMMRPEVQKNKELKALSTKPLSQLTDDELFRIYAPVARYLSDNISSTCCTTCDLCEKRREELEKKLREET